MLDQVRSQLLEEARKSPSLLSDLAGLEQYVAESYDARSFVELLQNADDAGASRFAITRVDDFLLVGNNGHLFTRADFESLCRSAASTKHRGTSIGYRGIGFKSVVNFAETVYVFSGDLEAVFSRERTVKEIPEATRVPLVRIPHPVDITERARLAPALEEMEQQELRTVFVFKDLIASSIEAEFATFDPTSLLFLRHIAQVELRTVKHDVISARRENLDARTRSVRLATWSGVRLWRIVERDGVALAFSEGDKGIERLDEREAVVHAFLPTHEPTGMALKVNGDISTDPSRTRVVLDERTAAGIESTAKLVVDLVLEALEGDTPPTVLGMVAVLIPYHDPRALGFQRRSFRTELFDAVQRTARGRFEDLRCRPTWLNAMDFQILANASRIRAVPRALEDLEGSTPFLKFMGAREATLPELTPGLNSHALTSVGAAEVVAHLAKLHATKQIDTTAIEAGWRLWTVDDAPVSLDEARQAQKPLDQSFLDMVSERVGVGSELRRMVASLLDGPEASRMVPELPVAESGRSQSPKGELQNSGSTAEALPRRTSLRRWRSAEQQVLSLLEQQGWEAEDVSRQNVGYDIEVRTPDGRQFFVEVKSIRNPHEPFIITSNEEAVARIKGEAYQLALVRDAGAELEVAFIQNPAYRLDLTRQCRQWVWECSSYEFNPQRYVLE